MRVMVILSDHDFDGEPVQVDIQIVSPVTLGTMILSVCVAMQSKCSLINTPLEADIKESQPFCYGNFVLIVALFLCPERGIGIVFEAYAPRLAFSAIPDTPWRRASSFNTSSSATSRAASMTSR